MVALRLRDGARLLRGRKPDEVKRSAFETRERLLREASSRGLDDVEAIGPAPAFMARVNDVYHGIYCFAGRDWGVVALAG